MNHEQTHMEALGDVVDAAILDKEMLREAVAGAIPEIEEKVTELLWVNLWRERLADFNSAKDEELLVQTQDILRNFFTDPAAAEAITRRVNQSLRARATQSRPMDDDRMAA